MKTMKKLLAVMLSAMFVVLCFAGCSSAGEADEITDETMLVAYTAENEPFIYTDENGELTGFDVEVMDKIFDDVKDDYKNYKFIQVDEDYKVGEDTAYTDSDGNEYVAYVMVGGLTKNTGSSNNDYTFTENIIDNRVIAVTAQNSSIASYADLKGVKAGVVSDVATTALDKNSTIKNNFGSLTAYEDASTALSDLSAGKIDVLIIDEFDFDVVDNVSDYVVLNGELDTISYVYFFKKWDSYNDSFNEAIYELKSDEYNDADEFTPIVEKYFGYNASNFDYNSQG
jgi:ABC-type amino acid transport substrate-binding protein